ncbi:hypothetical protein ELG97_03365 [Rhizobium leguminosarum]|uniref:Uncharacterized protein n=1 Tax=Rhizobium leguminosarum TaxID=384 RepID=A0A7M3DPR4_RHILE|nr:hypothetical protein [Rhizobium leguminosarum bv. viciae]TAY50672.1 hypothetical protein ELH90_02580 [Rhizobium leguminosarum]NKK00856.1 hypothetical protein [Rhizobium leguminosarum bv. viciae]NKK87054.1 hypothetical protein [Rhizobium leguminosarum bv. viciae]NKK95227.1 hypothetical protein [Rhizobium leguminosarum bv. viciae]
MIGFPKPSPGFFMPCSVLCASFQTRKGRCNILDLREFLSENRFRLSGLFAGLRGGLRPIGFEDRF